MLVELRTQYNANSATAKEIHELVGLNNLKSQELHALQVQINAAESKKAALLKKLEETDACLAGKTKEHEDAVARL